MEKQLTSQAAFAQRSTPSGQIVGSETLGRNLQIFHRSELREAAGYVGGFSENKNFLIDPSRFVPDLIFLRQTNFKEFPFYRQPSLPSIGFELKQLMDMGIITDTVTLTPGIGERIRNFFVVRQFI